MNHPAWQIKPRGLWRWGPRAFAAAVLILLAGRAEAQIGRDSIPSTVYYAAFNIYNNGSFQDALNTYNNELRGGIKTSQARWIDSICYHTMTGECYYQLGKLPQALEQFTSALQLYSAYHNWMIRVQFPPGLQPGANGTRASVPWGQSKRGTTVGNFPASYQMSQGQINNNNVVQRGGVVTPPIIVSVNVSEIVRATCLAMRRRRELLGPMCKHDPLSNELVAKLTQSPGQPNHWSQAWIDVQLGAAYASVGNMAQAVGALNRSLVVGTQYDHPLTSTGLIELGRLALEAGNFDVAATMFEEATYSAVNFEDTCLLEEAFRLGQMTHLLANRKGVYPLLTNAVGWAKSNNNLRHLHASLALLAAENLSVLGQVPAAINLLNDARNSIGARTDMANAAIGARANFILATTSYQSGNATAGDQALAAAINYQKTGSLWNFQINWADQLYTRGDTSFSDRIGMLMYETLLRDPTPVDWSTSPLESLSVMVIPHPLPYEHWFEAAQSRRGEQELALEIADRAKRHRFYTSLPMGGRLLALRWLLEGPTELLTERAALQRQDLLARYPRYDQLAQQARKLRSDLAQKPLVEETNEARREQGSQLANLAALGQAQEAILREMAVRREPADLVFPPVRKTKDLQAALQPGQVLLSFFTTSRNTYGFVFTRDKYTGWRVTAPALLQKQILGLLREIGQFDQNHQLGQTDLQSSAWRKSAAKIMEMLFDKSSVDLATKFDELIIVPDGALWYLPFELLPAEKGDRPRPLLAHVRIRYAPTVGLGVPYMRTHKPRANIGVVLGKLHPQDDEAVSRTAFDEFARSVPDAVALSSAPPAPTSVYRALLDELVLLDDIEPGDGGPYEWSPGQLDRGKPGSSLASWFSLPWGGPERVLLPGYHTAAENGLKKNQEGNDLFLSICGLMATGARTILISRWRTAGENSYDLVREFAQELPHTAPSDAWQRAVQIAATTPLEPELEPRLKKLPADENPPKASHPFFWAGYLVVDSGVMPDKPAEAPAPPPVLNVKPVGAPAPNAPAAAAPPPAAVNPVVAPKPAVRKP